MLRQHSYLLALIAAIFISSLFPSTVLAATTAQDLDYRFVCIGQLWMDVFFDFPTNYREKIMPVLDEIKEMGFKGVSVHTNWFLDLRTNRLFPAYDPENEHHAWMYSAEDWMIEELLRCIEDSGLDADLRIAVMVSSEEFGRFDYFPSYGDAAIFFDSYEALAVRLARILERTDGDVFTVFGELPMIEKHSDRVRSMLDTVAKVFSGDLQINQATNHLIQDFPEIWQSGDMNRYKSYCGDYWNWEFSDGRKVIIAYSWWPGPSQTTYSAADNLGIAYSSTIENMVEQISARWQNVVEYHRKTYPGHMIVFGELGIYNYGNQMMANLWQAYLTAIQRMGVDGFNVWSISLSTWAWYGRPKALTPGHDEMSGEPVISAITPFLD